MASADCTVLNVTMGHKLYSYLERKPQNYDVSFSVGPQKIIVKALKVILKSSSAVFEKEFEERWENAVLKEGEGIPLPRFDADAFKLFVKLMIVDTWSVAAIKELNLSTEQIFNLLSICRKYEMTTGVQSLEELSEDVFLGFNFGSYIESNEFLSLSQTNLEAILASDHISVTEAEIFEGACRWAKKQCRVNRVDPTGGNIRDTLGGCLFKIRFPTMTFIEFTKVIGLQGLLTAEETVEIYRFIGANDKQSASNRLPFPTNNRVSVDASLAPNGFLILSLATIFDVYSNSSVDTDGKRQYIAIKPGKTLAVYELGFLGPMNNDALYKVSVRITRRKSGICETEVLGQVSKQILAAKNKHLFFSFDEPVTLDPLPIDRSWTDCYIFYYTLTAEGHNVAQQGLKTDGCWHEMQVGSNQFAIITGGKPLIEILFKNV